MSGKLGIAILGLAHSHAEPWARGIASDPRARLAAVWDTDAQRGKAFALRFGARFAQTVGEAIGPADVCAVAITSEHSLRPRLVTAACEAGKHILCEKPMATTLDGCGQIARAVDMSGVTFMQAFQMRHDPVNIHVRDLVRDGSLGRVGIIYKRHSHSYGLDGWPNGRDEWFFDPSVAGGGAGMDQLIHSCDWLRWVFGEPRSVSAQMRTMLKRGRVEDNITATFSLVDGPLAVLHSSWTEIAGTVTTQIFGDEGTIIQMYSDLASSRPDRPHDSPLLVYRIGNNGWQRPIVREGFGRAHEAVVEAFITCLIEGTPPSAGVADGEKAVAMVLAAYEAAQRKREVLLA
ncbi:MAG: Gfo/Idh/MocA family oxidoreductase [Chloroflexota bacterium]|nr:Gfo/Idh/MocA family oxidoreductase [Chloroflexota bacterium]